MPVPNAARGAASRKNLRRGGVKARTREDNEQQKEVRRIAKNLLNRPAYRATLQSQLDAGKLHPSVHVMLYYYAYGKPVEIIETKQMVPVHIKHEYSE